MPAMRRLFARKLVVNALDAEVYANNLSVVEVHAAPLDGLAILTDHRALANASRLVVPRRVVSNGAPVLDNPSLCPHIHSVGSYISRVVGRYRHDD
jgi:hypothetical protein